MNLFGFDTVSSIMGLIGITLSGLVLGFVLSFAKFILFGFMETKAGWSNWGKGVNKNG